MPWKGQRNHGGGHGFEMSNDGGQIEQAAVAKTIRDSGEANMAW